MVSIYSLLYPECVLLHPKAEEKADLIKLMIDSLEKAGRTIDKEQLFKDVMERERLSSTGLDYGCAIPHAQSEALEETVMAAALLEKGVDFNSPDGNPAQLVFLIAGPKNQAGHHLKLLSKMSRILHDNEFRNSLEKIASVSGFLDLVKKRED
ncbi:PTS sugar transporter subunit IIA [Oceanispirochaeta sp.]|jgi:fructose-specific phosphotransferase system IIA component|uniref:PTS sugar transporter subunit IIA n=1 Tax=Oceanispirochaeta sp. TaxID=2035350 RepID=UPI002622AAF2|nr:PTS sugar transporter subunit IIA [Oceanispirochaeta sp.]MDA3957084.1 PTS sugar transporter subunit IIA [Oceanispirochaeta sp.]